MSRHLLRAPAAELDATEPEDDTPSPQSAEREPLAARVVRSLRRGKAVTTALAVVTVIAVAGAIWAGLAGIQAARSSAAADEAGAAAGELVTRLLSYDAASLDADKAGAEAATTGTFHDEYVRLLADRIIPAAREQGATSTAEVSRHAVGAASPDRVVVLLFINQTTTGNHLPAPRIDAGTARVTLNRTDGGWLISGMDAL